MLVPLILILGLVLLYTGLLLVNAKTKRPEGCNDVCSGCKLENCFVRGEQNVE